MSGLPTVLLLHGQPGGAQDWDRVVDALGSRAHALAIDRPGWDGRTPAADLAGNVVRAVSALDAAGARRATVVGHSFGGAVACALALAHPERVAGLVLAAPAANAAAQLWIDRWLATPLAGDLASAASLTGLGLALAATPLRGWIARELGLEDGYLRTIGRRLLLPASWQAFVAEQRTLVRELPALDRRLGEISAPATIVGGRNDRVVPAGALRQLAGQIPAARLVLIDAADHLLPLRQAAEFAELIVEQTRV